MEYREIVAVTGLSGLYQLLTTKSDGAIVRSVADKSTKFISARQHSVTPLESIEVYTTGDNVRLQEVFLKMQEHEATIPLADAKTADNAAIKYYFKSIFPEFDDDRVYVSDMKKMLKWYELLKGNDLLHFEEKTEEATAEDAPAADNEATEQKEAEPVMQESKEAEAAVEIPKKVNAKKSADTGAVPESEEQPKKAPKKKKAESTDTPSEEKPPKKTAKKKKTEE